MANQRIDIDVGLKLDKTGLNQIKSSLQEIKNLTAQDLMKIGGHNNIKQAQGELDSLKKSIAAIDGALDKAFNTDLGTLNVSKFNQALKGMNLNQVYKDFSAAGAAGQATFRNVTSQILTTNMQLKQTHNFLDNMATTMANTVKWGVASSVMNNFTGSVQKAYGYVKSLDTSLNDIRIVTSKSADEMERFAVKANNAAKELGKSTTDYTKASLIYYQQGLSDEDVEARAETTLKAANVTGQSGEAVSEQLTAVWNGYKVSAEEAELYIDKLAAVAAKTAADLEELSTGMSKVASAADLMGVDIDQLNAQMATIVSVTRQAPESVGTALKTIYARMGDIESGLDAETTLGHYTEEMKAMGVNVLDANGKLRDMGSVIEEIGGKWQSMSREQQIALSQTMAGTRQYNNLLSLFDNWDMYTKALETSANAAGTLQEQQDIYMESTQAHLNQLRAASEDLYDSLLDTDTINGVADGLTFVVKRFTDLVDGIGGGGNALLSLGSIATRVFSQQIAKGIATSVNNFKAVKDNMAQINAQMQILQQFKDVKIADGSLQQLITMKSEIMSLGSIVTQEQHNEANAIIQTTNELENQKLAWQENLTNASNFIMRISDLENVDLTKIDSDDILFYETISALDDFETELKQTNKEIDDYAKTLKEAKMAAASYNSDTSAENAKEETLAFQNLRYSLMECSEEMLQMADDSRLLDSQQEELINAVTEFKTALDSDDLNLTAEGDKLLAVYRKVVQLLKLEAQQAGDAIEGESSGTSQKIQDDIEKVKRSWNNFITNLKTVQKFQSIANLVGGIGQLVSVINTLASIKDIISDESLSDGEKTLKIITALTMAIPMLITGLKTVAVETGNLAIFTGLLTKEQIAQMTTAQGLKAAWMAEDGALKSLVTTLGIYALALAAVAGTVYLIVKAYNKERDALEEANKAVQNQTAELERLKAAQEEVNRSLEAYENAAEKVKTLTEGTQEWRDAINEANSAALELLDKYPELASEIKNVNSELQISEDGLKEFAQAAEAEFNRAQSDLYLTKAGQLEAQNAYSAVEAGRNIQYQVGNQQFTVADETINKVVEKINESGSGFLKDAESIQEELGITNKELAEALHQHHEPLEKLAAEVAANTAALQLYNSQALKGYLSDEDYLNASDENKALIEQVLGPQFSELQNQLYEDKYKDTGLTSQLSDATIQKLYAEQIGAEASKNKGKNVGEYLIDGEWKTISDNTARLALAAAEAAGELDGLSKGVIEASSSLDQMNIGEDIKSAILGFSSGQTADLSEMSFDQLAQLDNTQITDEIASSLGYEGENPAKQYMEAIDTAINNELGNRAEKLQEEIANAPDTIAQNLNGVMSMRELKQFNKAGGIDMSAIDPEMFNTMLEEGLSLEDVFSEIDWASIDSSEPTEWFKNAFEQAVADADYAKDEEGGVEAKYGADAEKYDIDEEVYRELTENMQEAAEASDELEDSLKDQEDTAQEVAKDLLRYDKAVESVKENSEDWLKILKSGNMQDIAANMGDIQEAYGNLLDIDASNLSDDFLQSTKNMEDLQAAANGSEEAYNRLAEAARQDMAVKVGFDDTEFQNEFNSLMEQVGNPPLDELKVGADLDNGNFLNKLSEMVNKAGMTAQEATDYLSSMGVDAEVEEDTTTTPETSTYVKGYTPKLSWESRKVSLGPLGDFNMNVPRLSFDAITETVKTDKQIAAHALKVTSAKKSSGGGFKHKNSSHGGGSKGGGKKSGGGGGGGGGSTPKHTTQDKTKGTVDRYRKINRELDELASRFEKLAQAQERLFGKDLYDNLTKQLDVLNKQIKASRQKLQIAKDEKKELQSQLKKKGFKFDKDGEISNYAKRVQYYEDQVNKYKKDFNNLSAKQQAGEKGEKLKEKIEKAEKKLNQVLDLIDDYDEVMNTIDEINEAIVEAAYEKIELKVQKFKLSVELRLDASEAIKDLADFKEMIYDSGESIQKTLDNAFKTVEDIKKSGVFGDPNTGDDQIVRGLHHKITNTIKALDSIDKGVVDDYSSKYVLKNDKGEYINEDGKVVKKPVFNEALAMETLEELTDELVNELEYVYDVYDQMLDGIVTTTDNVIEVHEKYRDALEEVQSVLEHAMNMVTMIKGEDAYKDIGAVIAQQLEQTGVQLEKEREASSHYEAHKVSLQTDIDALSNKIATQQAIADDASKTEDEREEASIKIANLEKERAALQESYDMYDEALQNSYANQREYVEQYTQLLIQQYENTIAQASKTFTSTLIGNLNMEGAQYEWDNLAREEEKYLDTVNKAYELKSLENKINESINSTDSLSVQKRLNQFKEEELKKLREKDKLTQYDIDRANQLYEIELKKIALEEAQNNKSKMRLRRDASGNYSYQFVADEDNVADAQQELDDAVNSLYNMDKDQYKQELQELQNLHQEYEDFRTWYSQQSAEFRAKNEQWYKDRCKEYEDQMVESSRLAEEAKFNTVQSFNDAMAEDFNETQLGEILPTWQTSLATMSEAINGSGESSFRSNSEAAMNAVLTASQQLDEGLQQLAATLGTDKEGLTTITSNYYTTAITQAETYATQQQTNIANTLAEAEAVRELTKEIEKLINSKTVLNSIQAVENSYEYQEDKNVEEANKIDGKKTTTTKKSTTTTKKKTTTTTKKKTTTKKEDKLTAKRKKGIAAAIVYGDNYSGWSTDPKRAERLKEIFGSAGSKVQDLIDSNWSKIRNGKKNEITTFYNENDISNYTYSKAKKFDTGGYTGSWNSSEGKIAMLHEKELVLNKEDTKNILAIVQTVRELMNASYDDLESEDYKKDLNSIIKKLSEFNDNLLTNLEAQEAIESGLISANSANQRNLIMSVEAATREVSEIYSELFSQNSLEFKEISSYLIKLQEYLSSQNLLTEDLSFDFEKHFIDLESFLDFSLIEHLDKQIDDFKSAIAIQQEKTLAFSEGAAKAMVNEIKDLGQHLMQDIKIQADFPNVVSSTEIEIAFNNLANDASQYAYRTGR